MEEQISVLEKTQKNYGNNLYLGLNEHCRRDGAVYIGRRSW